MTRLERLAKLRVKLAAIERTKAGARVGRLDGRLRQIAMLADGYSPDIGTARGDALAACAAFAGRLACTGETIAREMRQAHVAAVQSEQDVHRAERAADRVMQRAALDRRGNERRRVRHPAKDAL